LIVEFKYHFDYNFFCRLILKYFQNNVGRRACNLVIIRGRKNLKPPAQQSLKTLRQNEPSLPQHTTDEALEILRTRYKKGEITKEQFEQMKKDLEM